MRFASIAKHRHIWPVSWLCQAPEVSRSGFHAWLLRPTSAREIHDARLARAIETSFKASDRTYGARPRVARCSWGKACLQASPDRAADAEQCFEGAAQPNFFVPDYFEANKNEYIEQMRAVSATAGTSSRTRSTTIDIF